MVASSSPTNIIRNVSLMPWFCLTALLHTIIVLERNIYQSWTIILSIATFIKYGWNFS